MSVEKSEVILSTLQTFGRKVEEVENQRKSAISECIGAIVSLKQLLALIEAHKKQAYSEESIRKQDLALPDIDFIQRGINEVSSLVVKTIQEKQEALIVYRGQIQAIENVMGMLDKEFTQEKAKAERITALTEAMMEPSPNEAGIPANNAPPQNEVPQRKKCPEKKMGNKAQGKHKQASK